MLREIIHLTQIQFHCNYEKDLICNIYDDDVYKSILGIFRGISGKGNDHLIARSLKQVPQSLDVTEEERSKLLRLLQPQELLTLSPEKEAKKISIYSKQFQIELKQLVGEVRSYPDKSYDDIIDDLVSRYNDYVEKYKRDLLSHFLLVLFDFDYEACQRGITKCIALNPETIVTDPAERTRLLSALWFVISQTYCKDDYSVVLDNITKRLFIHDDYDVDDLPFK